MAGAFLGGSVVTAAGRPGRPWPCHSPRPGQADLSRLLRGEEVGVRGTGHIWGGCQEIGPGSRGLCDRQGPGGAPTPQAALALLGLPCGLYRLGEGPLHCPRWLFGVSPLTSGTPFRATSQPSRELDFREVRPRDPSSASRNCRCRRWPCPPGCPPGCCRHGIGTEAPSETRQDVGTCVRTWGAWKGRGLAEV